MNKNSATSFQKHERYRKECFRNVVAPFSAKMRFRPKGGIAFLPPDFYIEQQNLQFNWLCSEIFQIKEKASIFSKSVAEKIP